jgi:hypothetical protein
MNAMLEPRIVAARSQPPFVVAGCWQEPARIAASSQGGRAMLDIIHSPGKSKRVPICPKTSLKPVDALQPLDQMPHVLSESLSPPAAGSPSSQRRIHLLRVFLLLLISSASRLLMCQSLQASADDPFRAAEIQRRAALGSVGQREHEMRAREGLQQRQFAAMFNQLVEAVNNFANRYNEGRGTVWPKREADKLRKAMRQVQQFEKSLRDDPAPLTAAERQRVH